MNFKKRRKITPEQKGTGEVYFQGQELHINPSPEVTLLRRKNRLERIRIILAGDTITPEKRAYLEKVERMLELQIKLEEGDF